jgi:hypothetical protein
MEVWQVEPCHLHEIAAYLIHVLICLIYRWRSKPICGTETFVVHFANYEHGTSGKL